MIHGNGFHKGPAWTHGAGVKNLPRTAIRLDFHGHKLGKERSRWKGSLIRAGDYAGLGPLQRLFVDEAAVVAGT
jgi:hypothetical protein